MEITHFSAQKICSFWFAGFGVCLGLSVVFLLGCEKQPKNDSIESSKTSVRNQRSQSLESLNRDPAVEQTEPNQNQDNPDSEIVDIIPWKPLNIENLRASAETKEWVLIDTEGLSIRQIFRGNSDYRSSAKVSEILKARNVDCYYFCGEMNGDADMSAVVKALHLLLREKGLELKNQGGIVGMFLNFASKQRFQIDEGTERELLQVLEKAKLPPK